MNTIGEWRRRVKAEGGFRVGDTKGEGVVEGEWM